VRRLVVSQTLVDAKEPQGRGSLPPEGVKRELEKMAAVWKGPPPLPWEIDK